MNIDSVFEELSDEILPWQALAAEKTLDAELATPAEEDKPAGVWWILIGQSGGDLAVVTLGDQDIFVLLI